MDGFTIVDGVVALVIVLSAILAYSRGFVREGLAIAGWVGAAVLAYLFASTVQPLVKEIPVIGNMLRDSCELSIIAVFAIVFAIGLMIMALFAPLFSSAVQRSVLGGLDQGLGFLYGVVRGVLLVAVAFIAYDLAVGPDSVSMVDQSRSAKVFAAFQGNINDNIPSDAPNWVLAHYENLTASCHAPVAPIAPEAAPAPATATN